MKKKIILLLCFILALNLCGTSAAFAGTAGSEKTMYAKQQTWIYSSGYQTAKYAVCPVGKNQQIKVGKKLYATMPGGKKDYYYQTTYFGKTFYIPADQVTTKKPKEAYTMTYSFKELLVTPKLYLYASPSFSSAKERTDEVSIYTIGEIKNWYVAFVSGKLGYISKKSTAIKKVKTPNYVPLHIEKEFAKSWKKNIKSRICVQYALLPSYMRDGLEKRDAEIYIQQKLKEPFETNGNGGYTTSAVAKATIYVKENSSSYNLEYTLHHEIGHALSRHLWPGQSINELEYLIQENKKLQLGSYYTSNAAEWLAESINILIKEPDQLKKKAPKTYHLLEDTIFGNTESPLRAA